MLTTLSLEVGCAGLPAAPSGELCEIDVVNQLAICTDIETAVNNPANAKPVTKALKELDNGVAVSPVTWMAIQSYIRKLKEAAQNSCK